MAESGALTSLTDKGVLPTKPVRKEPRQWRKEDKWEARRRGRFCLDDNRSIEEILHVLGQKLTMWRRRSIACLSHICTRADQIWRCILSVSLSSSLTLTLSFSNIFYFSVLFFLCSLSLPLTLSHSLSFLHTDTHSLTESFWVSPFLLWYLAVLWMHLFAYVIVQHLEAGCYNKSEDLPHTETFFSLSTVLLSLGCSQGSLTSFWRSRQTFLDFLPFILFPPGHGSINLLWICVSDLTELIDWEMIIIRPNWKLGLQSREVFTLLDHCVLGRKWMW